MITKRGYSTMLGLFAIAAAVSSQSRALSGESRREPLFNEPDNVSEDLKKKILAQKRKVSKKQKAKAKLARSC